jgi:hypothetical protein
VPQVIEAVVIARAPCVVGCLGRFGLVLLVFWYLTCVRCPLATFKRRHGQFLGTEFGYLKPTAARLGHYETGICQHALAGIREDYRLTRGKHAIVSELAYLCPDIVEGHAGEFTQSRCWSGIAFARELEDA